MSSAASGPSWNPPSQDETHQTPLRPGGRRRSPLAAGAAVFAAVLMLCNGTISILQGITGIAKDDLFVATPRYVYRFDLTTWGWLHLALGVLLVAVGAGVLAGQGWARWSGVFLAAVSLVLQFMFLPYYPLWSLAVIAVDVFIIWGLASIRSSDEL
ncbi:MULTISPECIES: hypothetical protein [Streptacidiphilus]|uniref:DUF7144 domain-containing protein n=1 Tax=Streptacidiphilus cavernicola TaxID=3342716 RepID=A0ABV6UQ10_9ACTN|nr:hypothetical protein [Streptacidiphilus jeojiense]